MIVLHAVPGAWLSQTETWLYRQVRCLPDDIESHVVCRRLENLDQFEVPNLHVSSAPARGRRRRRLEGPRPEVVHSHFGPEGWRNHAAVRMTGARHVVSFYGYDVNHVPRASLRWRLRYRQLFKAVDLVLCEGEHMARAVEGLGCPGGKVRVHRLGVDLDAIEFRPRSWDGVEPLRVLMAGSFREKKGLPLALEALSTLSGEVDLEITIIGDATAAPGSFREKNRILAAIQRHGPGSTLRTLGFQPHGRLLAEAYRHHLFVCPSLTAADGDSEGGAPVALIEMVASGMPVVSTRHCDIPGVVRHGVSGYLAQEHDVKSLGAQIRRMLSSTADWPEMLAAGRAWVEERFDAARQGRRLGSIYTELAGDA